MKMTQRSIVSMILLSIVTCGIYDLYWMYHARSEFQQLSGDTTIKPGTELLFSIICLPYTIYWIYKFSTDIANYQKEHGLQVADNAVLNVILALVCLIPVSCLLIQKQLNELA